MFGMVSKGSLCRILVVPIQDLVACGAFVLLMKLSTPSAAICIWVGALAGIKIHIEGVMYDIH